MADNTYELDFTGSEVNTLLSIINDFHSHITVGRQLSDNQNVINGNQIELNNVTLAGEYEIPSGSTLVHGPKDDPQWSAIGLIVDEISDPSDVHANEVSILRQTIFRDPTLVESIYTRYRYQNGTWTDWIYCASKADIDLLNTTIDGISDEINDAQIGIDQISYGSLGAAIRSQAFQLISTQKCKSVYTIYDFIPKQIWASNGVSNNPDNKRSKFLYPVDQFSILHVDENTYSGVIYVNFYDKDGVAVGRRLRIYKSASDTVSNPCIAPKNAAMFGITMLTSDDAQSVNVNVIYGNPPDCIDSSYADNGSKYLVLANRENNSATNKNIRSSTDFDLIAIPTGGTIEKMYLSAGTSALGVISVDSDDNWTHLNVSSKVKRLEGDDVYEYNSRYYNIPLESRVLLIEFPRADGSSSLKQLGADGENCSYISIYKSGKNDGLHGKSVLCVGDSNTYLDQMVTANPLSTYSGVIVGWQRWIRCAGAFVTTLGGNGYSYAKKDGMNSLYTRIVEDAIDVSSYNIILLNAGSNDIGNNISLGEPPADDGTYETDPETICGALNGIIEYIKSTNPEAQIFIVISHQHKTKKRNYTAWLPVRSAEVQCAEFWGCQVIDLFGISGISEKTFDYYLYDGTHLNSRAMKRFGEIITSKLLYSGDSYTSADGLGKALINAGDYWEV